jgi:hypothetical protein
MAVNAATPVTFKRFARLIECLTLLPMTAELARTPELPLMERSATRVAQTVAIVTAFA